MLLRSLVVGVATVGLSGLTPDLSGRSITLVFGSAAYAQDVSNAEVTKYARAVLVMEPVRQAAFNQIKSVIGSGDVPPIVCHKPQSLDALPGDARNIAVTYCSRSKEIVESNGLTIGRFNTITMNLQNDSNLKKRIQDELIRIQKASGS